MEIKLEQMPYAPFRDAYGRMHGCYVIEEAPPFVLNSRAILIHRARWAVIHHVEEEPRHCSVHLWCGNSFNRTITFIEDVPRDRILCERCEMIAVLNGQLPADELCGRHVHVGRLRAFRTCCTDEPN